MPATILQANKKTDPIGNPLNESIISQLKIENNHRIYRSLDGYYIF